MDVGFSLELRRRNYRKMIILFRCKLQVTCHPCFVTSSLFCHMSFLFCHVILVLSHHPYIVTSSLFCHIIIVLSHVILVLSHHAGDSSDDFVVIIPPCFDPHAPLAGLDTRHREADSQEGLAPLGWEILPSPTGPLVQLETPITNEEPPKRVSPSSSPKANKGVTPNCGRRTLRDATLREPLSVATGLVNSVANFVKDVHFTRAQNSQSADLALQEMLPGEVHDLSGEHTEEEDLEDLLVRVVCVFAARALNRHRS